MRRCPHTNRAPSPDFGRCCSACPRQSSLFANLHPRYRCAVSLSLEPTVRWTSGVRAIETPTVSGPILAAHRSHVPSVLGAPADRR